MKTIGFIGCGNMGKAMVEGIMKAQLVDGEDVYKRQHKGYSKNRKAMNKGFLLLKVFTCEIWW